MLYSQMIVASYDAWDEDFVCLITYFFLATLHASVEEKPKMPVTETWDTAYVSCSLCKLTLYFIKSYLTIVS